VGAGNRSVYKDFAVRIGPEVWHFARPRPASPHAENIQTRSYFNPALHQQRLFRAFTPRLSLDHTEALSREVLCLPISARMSPEDVDRVAEAIANIQRHAADIRTHAGQLTPVR